MNTEIIIIDAPMGTGKTSKAIQMMNEDLENSYIYITPFLSEVQRIKQSCKERRFVEPKNFGEGKLNNLHDLLIKNKNIASTHALFRMSNEDTHTILQSNDYNLILDEVMDVVKEVKLKRDDIKYLMDNEFITIQDDGLVVWNENKLDIEFRYDDIKRMSVNKTLFYVNNTLLMWTFPVEIFRSFKKVYVMSYLFDAQVQKYYYDLHNIKYKYYTVEMINERYELVALDKNKKVNREHLKSKINILDDNRLNAIGENKFSLSSTWYKKNSLKENHEVMQQLKNNIHNYFKRKIKGKSKYNMWTTFKSSKGKLSGEGYTKGFIPVNSRATNEYAHKNNLVYPVNIFLNPILKRFFEDKNVLVNEDKYALSEMLQWIWRSAIRNNEPINIYIPSSRMRELFLDWLDGNY